MGTVRFEIGGDDGSTIGSGCPRSPRGRHLSCGEGERQRRSSLRQHWDENEDDAATDSVDSQENTAPKSEMP